MVSKNIFLPQNCVDADLNPRQYPDRDIVVRGKRLYDRKEHSYQFNETIYADITLLLPFEEIPEAARRYITVRAARIYQDRAVGSDTLHKFNEKDELKARAILVDYQTESADATIFGDTPGILSTWSVGKILVR
jgi:hypothetical protein